MKKLTIPLMIGCIFGALSVFLVQFPDKVGAAAIFLMPGFVLAIVTGKNVHDLPTWPVVVGNFLFYFGVTYIASAVWEKHTHKVNER